MVLPPWFDFSVFILFHATLLDVLTCCRNFLVESMVYFMDRIILSSNKDTHTFLFLYPLVYFTCFTVPVKTWSSMLNMVERLDILVLFPILLEMLWVFLHLDWCWLCDSCISALLCWDMYLVSLLSLGILTWMDIGFCHRFFFASNELIVCFLSFILFIW